MTTWRAVRGPLWLGAVTLLLLAAGGFGWGATARITNAVIAPGQIAVAGPKVPVQHPDGGAVARLAVSEGALVAAGDVLLRLDPAPLDAETGRIETARAALDARRARLSAERTGHSRIEVPTGAPLLLRRLLAGEQRHLDARNARILRETALLDSRETQVSLQISGLSGQRAALREQLALVAAARRDQDTLVARGLAPDDRLLSFRTEEIRLAARISEIDVALAVARERKSEIAQDRLARESARREETEAALQALAPELADLDAQRAAIDIRRARLALRAPVAGTVHDLQPLGPGAVLQPAMPALWVVPSGTARIVRARIAPGDVDLIARGQPVRLRLTGLAARDTPELTGRVHTVSADLLQDGRADAPHFRAEIIPDWPEDGLPGGLQPVPGMPVEVIFQTTPATPLHLVLRPLSDYFTRAFSAG